MSSEQTEDGGGGVRGMRSYHLRAAPSAAVCQQQVCAQGIELRAEG